MLYPFNMSVIFQTKKRYVGFMYETPDQQKPVYDAKGIETVRRDGCPAVAKVLCWTSTPTCSKTVTGKTVNGSVLSTVVQPIDVVPVYYLSWAMDRYP